MTSDSNFGFAAQITKNSLLKKLYIIQLPEKLNYSYYFCILSMKEIAFI